MLSAVSVMACSMVGPWQGIDAQPLKGAPASIAQPTPTGSLQLKVRRLSDAVELVIEGTGPRPQLAQSLSGSTWQGQLSIAAPNALRLGPQRVSIPELGLQQVTIDGSGQRYQIDVTPTSGLPLLRPVVSADGQNMILTFPLSAQTASLQTVRPNLNQPGAIPQPTYAPPLQPRASAPPVGDMAVGTMVLRNTSFINLRGPRITMTLRNASAKDTLMALARIGNYGFVYVDDNTSGSTATSASTPGQPSSNNYQTSGSSSYDSSSKVNISFVNEDYSRAVNAVLLASGLSARLEGSLILAGKSIQGKSFGARLSKVYRLNQVSPASAADYLANLGASVTKTNTISTAISSGTTQQNAVQGAPNASTTTSSSTTLVESYGATSGPLLGLQATTDSRLGTITLIGDAGLVGVAEQYLRQLDLRQRQVALSVKILDLTLDNNSNVDNSFAFRSGNSFILSQNGQLTATFGALTPNSKPSPNPGLAFPTNQLMDQVSAMITSSNTKILASPTLILSENPEPNAGSGSGDSSSSSSSSSSSGSSSGGSSGYGGGSIGRPLANEGFVVVGEKVVTGYNANTTQTTVTCTPIKETAGLTFGARINKIDDNGYVTFSMSPQISAQVKGGNVPGCGDFFNVVLRRLDTGVLRVRDGQTLVLTGVLSDDVIATVTKWPIVGDLPLIGQFFRANGSNRRKNELVIMVTPRILREDDSNDPYGYGYLPSSQDARQFMGGS